jgi:hypothetical protein
MKNLKNTQRNTGMFLAVLFLLIYLPDRANSQLIDVKPWSGTYPEMNGSYPLTFISFSGQIIPIPHVFVRVWPTHYYVDAVSVPVTDATEIAGGIKTGFLRLAEKLIERELMKGRQEKTGGIKLNTNLQKEITQTLFDARSDQLEDNCRLADGFIKLYDRIGMFREESDVSGVADLYEKEADALTMRFLLINLLKTDHGEKLKAFSEIQKEQNRLTGEADYTLHKIRFYSLLNAMGANSSYTFLTQ